MTCKYNRKITSAALLFTFLVNNVIEIELLIHKRGKIGQKTALFIRFSVREKVDLQTVKITLLKASFL
jgi:hypothetical protein